MHSDFQVANSDTPRLPTLKELIGYQTYDYTTTPSSVFLNLLLTDDKNLEFDMRSFANDQIKSNVETIKTNDLKRNLYESINDTDKSYLSHEINDIFEEQETEDNDIDDKSLTDKKRKTRIDHAASTTTTLKPTTMRGTPIISSTLKTITRGFYVTKGEIEMTTIISPTTEILMENIDSNISNNETILSKNINEEDNIFVTPDLSEDNSMTSSTTFTDSDKQYSEYSSVVTKFEQTTPLIMAENISQEVTQDDYNLFTVNNVLSTSRKRKIEYTDVTIPLYRPDTNLIPDTTTEMSTNSKTKVIPIDYTLPTEYDNTEFDITMPGIITSTRSISNTPKLTNEDNRKENIIELENVLPTTVTTKLTNDQSETNQVVTDNSVAISNHASETTTAKLDLTTPNSVATFETITPSQITETTRWTNVEATTMIAENTNSFLDTWTTTSQEELIDSDVEDKIVSKSNPNVQRKRIFSTSTVIPSSTLLPSLTPLTTQSNREENIHRRRQRQRIFVLNNQFGQRKRPNLNRRVTQIEDESSIKEESKNPKRVLVYRKRQRRPNSNSSSTTVASDSVIIDDVESKVIDNKTRRSKLVIKRLKINRKEQKKEEEEEEEKEEKEEEEKSIPLEKTNILQDSPLVTEYTERPMDEGSVSKNSGSSSNRTPGTILANRIRKPNPSSLSSLLSTSKRPILLGDNRKNRPSETILSPTTTIVDLFDDDATVKPEEFVIKDEDERAEISDQNGRAQELAVTLADPPTLQSSSNTGRVPLRETLRRRISTTVAPRTDFPRASSTSLRFSTVPKTRQKTLKTSTTITTTTTTANRRKEGTTRSSTIRPRRPQIIDYDYYEDEDTPIVEKSMYNGKLFLTNSGTIRCLDQGNFPHPISCKKFITCAKMVNGLIIGAEYTCPDKLSFDPVGGICNWSAGLGCKE